LPKLVRTNNAQGSKVPVPSGINPKQTYSNSVYRYEEVYYSLLSRILNSTVCISCGRLDLLICW